MCQVIRKAGGHKYFASDNSSKLNVQWKFDGKLWCLAEDRKSYFSVWKWRMCHLWLAMWVKLQLHKINIIHIISIHSRIATPHVECAAHQQCWKIHIFRILVEERFASILQNWHPESLEVQEYFRVVSILFFCYWDLCDFFIIMVLKRTGS